MPTLPQPACEKEKNRMKKYAEPAAGSESKRRPVARIIARLNIGGPSIQVDICRSRFPSILITGQENLGEAAAVPAEGVDAGTHFREGVQGNKPDLNGRML